MTDRLWSRIDRREPDECWPWSGFRTKAGYGRLGSKIAHRLVYERSIGTIPLGLFVLHRCDNPSCCNPAHLFVGTARANSADMVSKGRSSRGERRPLAKLTDQQAREIREDKRFLKEIAATYGISDTLVSAIRTGQRWRHL